MGARVVAPPTGVSFARYQSAAVPYRHRDDALEVMLITSRRTGRWGVPKGRIEPHLTPWESAAQEAYEEAGVVGEVYDRLIGEFRYIKRARPQHVRVYLLEVMQVRDTWEEQHERERKWMAYEAAAQEVDLFPLQRMIQQLPEWIAEVSPRR